MAEEVPLKEITWKEVQPIPEARLQSSQATTSKERELMNAVTDGCFWIAKQVLESREPAVDINCTDSFGKTPLILATEKRRVNTRILQLLVDNGANIETALLHAVSHSNLENVKILLRYRPKEGDKSDINENTNISYITPVMLASKLGNYEMVKLLISHGEKVLEHSIHCSCGSCSSVETNIARAIIRLESYKALSNPMYISAQYIVNPDTVEDPIYTACVLNKKLRKLAVIEYEFKEEYLALCKALDNFSVGLLNECQHIKEVQSVMDMGDGEDKESQFISDEARKLNILNFAIKNENEKFIAHSFSQLMLNNEIYRKFPKLKNVSLTVKYFIMMIVMVLFPVWTSCYLFLPNCRVTRLLRTPLAKYMVFIGSHHVFLLLLVLTTFQSDRDFLKFSVIDWLVVLYLIGYCLDIGKEIYRTGRSRYFSNWYNYILVTMVTVFILHHIIWLVGYVSMAVRTDSWSTAIRNVVKLEGIAPYETVLVSYSFYSLGILLAFIYLLSMFHLHPTLGPLLMTLLRMLKDVANFSVFFLFLFIAFVVCLKKLYLQYEHSRERFFPSTWKNTTHTQKMSGITGSAEIVFWSLFGQVELDEFETESNYSIIKATALVLFAAFNVLAILVALNMLIAMLNESYVHYASETDVRWKYSRTKMLLALMHKSSVLPPPVNIIPTPRAIVQLFQSILRVCCRSNECCKVEYFSVNKSQRKTTDNRKQRQNVIRRLVLRHLWSAKMNNKSTTSTVEELDRARQDLARLLMPLSAATEELKEKQNKDEQDNNN